MPWKGEGKTARSQNFGTVGHQGRAMEGLSVLVLDLNFRGTGKKSTQLFGSRETNRKVVVPDRVKTLGCVPLKEGGRVGHYIQSMGKFKRKDEHGPKLYSYFCTFATKVRQHRSSQRIVFKEENDGGEAVKRLRRKGGVTLPHKNAR